MSELVAAQLADHVAVAVDQLGALHVRARRNDGVERAHPAEHLERGPAHVDLVPADHQ